MPKGNFTPAIDCTDKARHPIALTPVESNQIKAIGYDQETKTLAVTFTRGPGNVYHYEGVEPEVHAAFMAAESKGKHFGEHIQILPSKKYSADPAAAEPAHDSEGGAAPTADELEAAGQERLIA